MLSACKFVDEVVLFECFKSEDDEAQSGHKDLIESVMPDVFVRGPRSQYDHFKPYLEPHNIPLEIVEAVDYTTTDLVRNIHTKK